MPLLHTGPIQSHTCIFWVDEWWMGCKHQTANIVPEKWSLEDYVWFRNRVLCGPVFVLVGVILCTAGLLDLKMRLATSCLIYFHHEHHHHHLHHHHHHHNHHCRHQQWSINTMLWWHTRYICIPEWGRYGARISWCPSDSGYHVFQYHRIPNITARFTANDSGPSSRHKSITCSNGFWKSTHLVLDYSISFARKWDLLPLMHGLLLSHDSKSDSSPHPFRWRNEGMIELMYWICSYRYILHFCDQTQFSEW